MSIIGIDIRVGEVMSVTKHPKADSLMICNVNLGKRAITVVTNDLNVKEEETCKNHKSQKEESK